MRTLALTLAGSHPLRGTRISLRSLLLPLLLAGFAQPAVASDQASAGPAVDPMAVEILRAALEPIQAANTIAVDLRTLFDVVQAQGHKLQFGSQDRFLIQRPDRARFETTRDDGRARDIRYDGSTITIYDRAENVFGQLPAPDTLDATFDYLELEIGVPLPLADLFYSDLSHLSGIAVAAEVVGTSRVGEWSCDHVAFLGEFVDWQVWVERSDARRLRKFVVTYHDMPGEPQFGAIFDRWDLTAKAPDGGFAFTPPQGAERIPVLARPASGRGAR